MVIRESDSAEAVSFSEQVPPDSESTLEYELPADGTIRNIGIRFYPGPQLDLRVFPGIKQAGAESVAPLVRTYGKTYFDGDDDLYQFVDLEKPVSGDEVIVMRAENNDTTTAYDYRVNMTVDFRNGVRSYISGVLSGVL